MHVEQIVVIGNSKLPCDQQEYRLNLKSFVSIYLLVSNCHTDNDNLLSLAVRKLIFEQQCFVGDTLKSKSTQGDTCSCLLFYI